jgi:hypothetical protein
MLNPIMATKDVITTITPTKQTTATSLRQGSNLVEVTINHQQQNLWESVTI